MPPTVKVLAGPTYVNRRYLLHCRRWNHSLGGDLDTLGLDQGRCRYSFSPQSPASLTFSPCCPRCPG